MNDNPLEGKIEDDSRIHARDLGWDSRKMNGLGYNAWPDRLFIPPVKKKKRPFADDRRPFWVEFKRKDEVPTPTQDRKIKELRSRGETVYVIDNFVSFKKVLESENGK